jgi:HEAT repeat protein
LQADFLGSFKGRLMKRHRDAILISTLLSCMVLICGFVGREETVGLRPNDQRINSHIAQLHSREAQQRAAAAYWLGHRGSAAERAIPALIELLGDESPVEVSKYRKPDTPDSSKPTLGEEAAAALVNIGRSSTDALIKTLITSPEAHARENAAWALGALHRRQLI